MFAIKWARYPNGWLVITDQDDAAGKDLAILEAEMKDSGTEYLMFVELTEASVVFMIKGQTTKTDMRSVFDEALAKARKAGQSL